MQQQHGRTHFGVAIEFINTWGAIASTNHSGTVQWGRCVRNKCRLEQRQQELFLCFSFCASRLDCSWSWTCEQFPGFKTRGHQQSPAVFPPTTNYLAPLNHHVRAATVWLAHSLSCCYWAFCLQQRVIWPPPSWAPPPVTSADFPVGLATLGKVRMYSSCFSFPSCGVS